MYVCMSMYIHVCICIHSSIYICIISLCICDIYTHDIYTYQGLYGGVNASFTPTALAIA